MKKQKKVKLLVFLFVILASILTWQGMSRERLPYVDNAVEQKALSVLDEMLKTGQKSGWNATAKYWVSLPDDKTRAEYVQLMGSPEFTFQGSIPAGKSSDLILYAMFLQTGNQVEVLMSRQNDEFKIISMKKAAK